MSPASAAYLRETADAWNDGHRDLDCTSTDTELAHRVGVEGYICASSRPTDAANHPSRMAAWHSRYRPPFEKSHPASEVVSPDALALGPVRAPGAGRSEDRRHGQGRSTPS